MSSTITIDDLNMKPFEHINITFPSHSFTMIAGSNKSGKTLLIKILSGLYKTEGKIIFNNEYLEKIDTQELYQKIHVFLGNDQWHFLFRTVEEELAFPLENLGYSKKEITKKIKEVVSLFSLQKVLRLNPNKLNKFLKIKVLLAVNLISIPQIIVLDDPTRMLTREEKKELLTILNHYQSMGVTIIMTTSSLEDCLLGNVSKLYILHKGKIMLEGIPLEIMQEDSILSKIGLKLPFMVDLCIKLKYYGLVDEIILDPERLVNYLWK